MHLAAKVTITGPFEQFEAVNVGGTRLLLDEARAAGVGRFVHVSSPSVAHQGRSLGGCGCRTRRPRARARAATRGPRPPPSSSRSRRDDPAGLRVIAVRPHVVWGPGDTQLVGRIVDRARAGRLPVLGDGAALIDTTYVDNAVDALVAALHADPAVYGEPYVVTNGEPRPVVELLAGICAASGVPMPRRHVPAALARGAGLAAGRRVAHAPAAGRAPADPVRRRAALDRALVRPAAHARGARLDAAGRAGRGPGPAGGVDSATGVRDRSLDSARVTSDLDTCAARHAAAAPGPRRPRALRRPAAGRAAPAQRQREPVRAGAGRRRRHRRGRRAGRRRA